MRHDLMQQESLNYTSLPNYTSIHQVRKQKKEGGVSLYIHQSMEFKIRKDLSINSDDVESISVEICIDNQDVN